MCVDIHDRSTGIGRIGNNSIGYVSNTGCADGLCGLNELRQCARPDGVFARYMIQCPPKLSWIVRRFSKRGHRLRYAGSGTRIRSGIRSIPSLRIQRIQRNRLQQFVGRATFRTIRIQR